MMESKTKNFKIKLQLIDPIGGEIRKEELTLKICDDPNAMIYAGQRLLIHIEEHSYWIDKNGKIIEQIIK